MFYYLKFLISPGTALLRSCGSSKQMIFKSDLFFRGGSLKVPDTIII